MVELQGLSRQSLQEHLLDHREAWLWEVDSNEVYPTAEPDHAPAAGLEAAFYF